MERIEFTFPYLAMNDVMRLTKSSSVEIIGQVFDNSCSMVLSIRADEADMLRSRLADIDGVTLTLIEMNRFPSAALFDLDGVLIDSETIYTEIWSRIERAHPTGIDNFALKIKGSTLQRILDKYFPEPDIRADVVRMLNATSNRCHFPFITA